MATGRKQNGKQDSIIVTPGSQPMSIQPRLDEDPDARDVGGRKVNRAATVGRQSSINDEALEERGGPGAQPRTIGMRKQGLSGKDDDTRFVMGGEHRRPAPRINMPRNRNR